MATAFACFSGFSGPLTLLRLVPRRTRTLGLSRPDFPRVLTMSALVKNSALISAAQLANELKRSESAPRLLDATWYMPNSQRDPMKEFELDRLPGAKRFDIDAPSLKANSDLPHMMPTLDSAAEIAAVVSLVPSTRPLVIYAQGSSSGMAGLIASARVWFHFRALGHPNVRVLNGGLWTFRQQGFLHGKGEATVEEDSCSYPEFIPAMDESFVWSLEDVRRNLKMPRAILLDARSQGRFNGTEPEPRAGLKGGHIPGSFCLPASECVNLETGLLKSRDQLSALLQERGIPKGTFATTCGSGVTAAIVALSLYELGHSKVPIYDGSWSEYGQGGLVVEISR